MKYYVVLQQDECHESDVVIGPFTYLAEAVIVLKRMQDLYPTLWDTGLILMNT